jgi:hypothetical protein
MSEIPTWPKVSGALGTTTKEFGALDWANLISDYFNGVNIGLLDASKLPVIGSITKFKHEKLATYDPDGSHYVVFSADDIDTGPVRKIKIRRMNNPFEEDYVVLEGLPQALLNKEIDSDLNTITNIVNADIKAGAAITVNKLAASGTDGHVIKTVAGVTAWAAESSASMNLDALTDVVISSPSTGQVVKYNGTNWINDTDATGGGGGAMDDLTDVTITSIAANQLIVRNGANTAYINSLLTNSMITNTTIDLQAKGVKGSGTSLQVLRVNSGASALEWASLDSERTGKALANGNGSTTVFTIAHGLGATPGYAFVDCSSHAIARTWTVDGTNITVTFSSAPSSGTNNVIIYWRVIA